MLVKIKNNPMHPLRGALPLLYEPARVTRDALVAHGHSFAVPQCKTSHCTTEPLFPSQCLCGTILVTLCLMVWDWRVLRAELMLCCWTNLLFLFVPYYLLFFLLPWVDCVELWTLD